MIEDVYEPLAKYRDEFKTRFARLVREKFKALTKASQVDVSANRRLVAEIKKLEKAIQSQRFKKLLLGCLMAVSFGAGIVALIGAILASDAGADNVGTWIFATVVGFAVGVLLIAPFRNVSQRLKELEAELEAKMQEAWAQMEPLNRLYTWDITPKLIEATVPRIAFDPYFTADRLTSLHTQFGWDDDFNDGKSVIFAQSGTLNGNPFVFGQYLEMEWGEETYEGTKLISWVEWEQGPDGKQHSVHRSEVLHAYVTKPIPVYTEQKVLLYGNDAAPNLSFSRNPSGFSGDDAGFLDGLKKKWRLSRLKSFSRNLKDDSDFTLMSNHEFETWFHAKDRDNEVEFRLLFTPIAQTQMLQLMKDTKVGYGDDFSFIKQRKVNALFSAHLNKATIETDPARFRNWNYDDAFSTFIQFNEQYFKDAYFALAPILAIPLYQQMRTHEDIASGLVSFGEPSFWEHEAIANYYGEKQFQHPRCITRSILKTQEAERDGGEVSIAVTAYGYRGEERVEYKRALGGDGNWHQVPVHWTEYLPVSRTSTFALSEQQNPSESFQARMRKAKSPIYRRSLYSFLPK